MQLPLPQQIGQSQVQQSRTKPIRVLHVVGGMSRGGIETWLMHVLRNIDRDRIQMDFLVHTPKPCAYDQEIKDLGSNVIPCLNPTIPLLYQANLKAILRNHGPYQIVHSHVHFFSGFVLRIAHQMGVPVRISHSHNNTSVAELQTHWIRKIYVALMRRWLSKYTTLGLAASQSAAMDLFGPAWDKDPRYHLLYYGVDLKPFESPIDPSSIRTELNLPPNAWVIGHVGRFAPQKNHTFLLQIAKELIQQEPNTYFLLIGEGELRTEIEATAVAYGIQDHLFFMGGRADVPRLMRGAMDVFLFPSHYEGLGLVLVEAQAAGLPCVTSTVVPQEADIIPHQIKRLDLSGCAQTWAAEILTLRTQTPPNPKDAYEQVQHSIFNLNAGITALTTTYENSRQP